MSNDQDNITCFAEPVLQNTTEEEKSITCNNCGIIITDGTHHKIITIKDKSVTLKNICALCYSENLRCPICYDAPKRCENCCPKYFK